MIMNIETYFKFKQYSGFVDLNCIKKKFYRNKKKVLRLTF